MLAKADTGGGATGGATEAGACTVHTSLHHTAGSRRGQYIN